MLEAPIKWQNKPSRLPRLKRSSLTSSPSVRELALELSYILDAATADCSPISVPASAPPPTMDTHLNKRACAQGPAKDGCCLALSRGSRVPGEPDAQAWACHHGLCTALCSCSLALRATPGPASQLYTEAPASLTEGAKPWRCSM